MDLPYQTLHCHSTNSDGDLTYEEVLDACFQNQIGVVAFTDHDAVVDVEKFLALKKLNHQVKFISGIEISADAIPEVNKKLNTFHITGLFVDPTNENLVKFAQHQKKARHDRAKFFVDELSKLGFKITEEDVMKFAKGDAVGRPHIVNALKLDSDNVVLLNKMFEELKEEAKVNPLRETQLKEILARDDEQKWYQILLSPNTIHSVYPLEDPSSYLTIDEAVKLIRDAGGVAMVAHWTYLRDLFTLDVVEKLLKDKRIDGMETTYSFENERQPELFWQDMQDLSALCQKYSAIEGGGGDFHRKENFAAMIKPEWAHLAERTIGMYQKMVEKHPEVKLDWTSLSQ